MCWSVTVDFWMTCVRIGHDGHLWRGPSVRLWKSRWAHRLMWQGLHWREHASATDGHEEPSLSFYSLSHIASSLPTLSTRPFVAQMQHWMLLHHALHNCSFQANLHHGVNIDRTLPPLLKAFQSFSTWVRGRGMDRERKMNCAGKWSEDGCHKQM